jgi:NADPH:quinone reductase-like Zn-dependent oxidoreductase
MSAERIVITRYGGPEVLKIEPFDPAPPADDEVSIAVRAIGINFADLFCRLGLYQAAPKAPFTPGFEVGGEVAAVGAGVDGFHPGDRVLALTRFGGYTSQLNVPAKWVRPIPNPWSFEQAAAFPVVFLTAYHGLVNVGRLAPGETVVVQSAAGGVGTAACQIAKTLGARVIGTVGSESKREIALQAGASEVVVSPRYRVWNQIRELTAGQGVDLVFDAVGGRELRSAYRTLRLGGRLVVYGFAAMMPKGGRRNWPLIVWRWLRMPRFNPLDLTPRNLLLAGFNLVYLWKNESLFTEALAQLAKWAEQGVIRPVVGATFAFNAAPAAHALLQSRRSTGKIVLTRSGS